MCSAEVRSDVSFMPKSRAGRPGLAHAAVHSSLSTGGYLSLTDAATYADLSVKTVRRRIADGTLPAYRTGRLIKIRREDLDGLFRQIPNGATR
jgi:excisionase family DNA binding protein